MLWARHYQVNYPVRGQVLFKFYIKVFPVMARCYQASYPVLRQEWFSCAPFFDHCCIDLSTLLRRPIKDDDPVLIMMFSMRLSGTNPQVAPFGTEPNHNLKVVCVYRLQGLVVFVGLLYLPIKKSEVYLSDNSPEVDFISAVFS